MGVRRRRILQKINTLFLKQKPVQVNSLSEKCSTSGQPTNRIQTRLWAVDLPLSVTISRTKYCSDLKLWK